MTQFKVDTRRKIGRSCRIILESGLNIEGISQQFSLSSAIYFPLFCRSMFMLILSSLKSLHNVIQIALLFRQFSQTASASSTSQFFIVLSVLLRSTCVYAIGTGERSTSQESRRITIKSQLFFAKLADWEIWNRKTFLSSLIRKNKCLLKKE